VQHKNKKIYSIVPLEVTVCTFVNDQLWFSWAEYLCLLFRM